MRFRAKRMFAAAWLCASGSLLVACSMTDVMRPEVDVTSTAAVMHPPVVVQQVSVAAPMVPQLAPPSEAPSYQPSDEPSFDETAPAAPEEEIQAMVVPPSPAPGLQRLVPSNPDMTTPQEPRQSAPVMGMMPDSEVQCRRQLKRLGVTYRDLAPINDGGSCGIAHPVELSALPGGVRMKPAATLTCAMALRVAQWTKHELNPSARLRYLSSARTIHQGSSYSCRRIRGSRTMSEHSKGNALDIMRIELKNGKDIDVRKPGFFAFRQRGLLNNVRADACGYFSTVLGPGYDRDHKDHFHFDIAQRRNGRKACR